MTSQLAAAALEFLKRASLNGAEVPAFVAVCQALSAIASPPAATEPAP